MDNQNNNFINTNATETNTSNGCKSSKPSKASKPKKEKKQSSGTGFGKTVVLPFVSGIIGATLVLGVCFSVPTIKSEILGNGSTPQRDDNSNINYNNVNMNLVSLSNISDTGVYVAQKVLPSIVGINVEYSVSSIFSRNQSTASAEGSGVIISE